MDHTDQYYKQFAAEFFGSTVGVDMTAIHQRFLAHLKPGAHILDAGCGLGAGLLELRRACPQARLVGIEWSLGLWALCAWRCRWAEVRRADLWAADWGGYDLVYLFQRPETLPRALQKARREMRPGSWLASLDFRHPDLAPTAVLQAPGRRALWLYRLGTAPAARPGPHGPGTAAGKPA